MHAKIFSFVKVTKDSMVASTRIARFIGDTLNIPICWDESVSAEQLDVLIIVGGAYAFAGNEILAALAVVIETTPRVVWAQNDYTVIPPKDESGAVSPFRVAFRNRRERGLAPVDYWTTVETMSTPGRHVTDRTGKGWRCGHGSFWINWNALTFDDSSLLDMKCKTYEDMLLYYGSFRKDRERYFSRYFMSPTVKTMISSPSKKFEEKYIACEHDDKISDTSWGSAFGFRYYLSMFGLGLYVEDVKSHIEFHSPANRFYEMLSAGLPMVFQPECQSMLLKAGYDVGSSFLARSAQDIADMMQERDDIARRQRDMWWEKAKAEHDSLTPKLVQMWEQYL